MENQIHQAPAAATAMLRHEHEVFLRALALLEQLGEGRSISFRRWSGMAFRGKGARWASCSSSTRRGGGCCG